LRRAVKDNSGQEHGNNKEHSAKALQPDVLKHQRIRKPFVLSKKQMANGNEKQNTDNDEAEANIKAELI
jgi:hypothetical protein